MDPRLVVAAQDGDSGAFAALAVLAHPRLQRIAVGVLRDPDLAEDAVQQALLTIWRDLPRLRDPSRFDGWSYRLLLRRCYAESRHGPRWVPTVRYRFTPSGIGTDAVLEIDYELPAGLFGKMADKLFIERAVERDLRHSLENFKAFVEAKAPLPV